MDLPGAHPAPTPQPYPSNPALDGTLVEGDNAESGANDGSNPRTSSDFAKSATEPTEDAQAPDKRHTAYSPVQPVVGEETVQASPISLPAARTLADRLLLTRALRPLRQSFPSQRAFELDEEATAELTAELQSAGLSGVFPVQRPVRERWFDVHVVLEDDPAAALWEAPLEEFARVLAQSGAFRLVRTWRLELDPAAPQDPARAALAPLRRNTDYTPNHYDRRAQAKISGDPRELIFFASHGASAHWLDGSYARLLLGWSSAAIALLHLLPSDRHAQTALGEPHGVALAQQAGASAAALRAEVMWWRTDADPNSRRAVRLPMATLDPAALGIWALAEMARGRRAPLYLLDADEAVDVQTARPDALTALEVEQRLAGVRERSSAAYELAIALSVGPFTLPVARVVQEVLFGSATDTTLLADLLLSGVVARDPHDGVGDATFRVAQHARVALARASRGEDRERLIQELQRRVGRQLGEKAAEALSFTALMRDTKGEERLSASILPFASFLTPIVQGLVAPQEPAIDVAGLMETLPRNRVGELYRLSIRGEALSERSIRTDLWRWMRTERLVVFGTDGWALKPELVSALRATTKDDPLFGLRILWVDDRPGNNRNLERTLRSRRVDMTQARSTGEAMDRSDLDHFDVVISDMSRPPNREAGFELIAALRSRAYQVPVIIFAGIFAKEAANRTRVREAGGFGCTNDSEQLLLLVSDAANVLLALPAINAQRPTLALENVRKGLHAQITAQYRLGIAGQSITGAAALNAERTRLVSLVHYRAITPKSTANERSPEPIAAPDPPPRPQWKRPKEQLQPQQQRQMQQAQGYAPSDRQAPFRMLVSKRVTSETRKDVESQLQLFALGTDRAVPEAQTGSSFRDTGPNFSPQVWHEAFSKLPANLGWTVARSAVTRGLSEEGDARGALRQMLDAGGINSSEIARTLSIVDDWQQAGERKDEVPSWLASSADYAEVGLHLRLAILLTGDQSRSEARLIIFSSFITKILARNVFLLRFSPKIENDTLVLSLTTSLQNLASLASSVDERLDAIPPDLLPLIETEDLDSKLPVRAAIAGVSRWPAS